MLPSLFRSLAAFSRKNGQVIAKYDEFLCEYVSLIVELAPNVRFYKSHDGYWNADYAEQKLEDVESIHCVNIVIEPVELDVPEIIGARQ